MTGGAGQDPAPVSANAFRDFFERAKCTDILDRPMAVGVSGGADSTSLMYLLHALPVDPRLVTILTVDHGLRPASAAEALDVRNLANHFGFAHETLRWEGAKPASDLQAAARKARYGLMTGWCAHHQIDVLMVAHTLDDQAETFLLRLGRGSGVDGLSAMDSDTSVNGIRLVRPLLRFPKARLMATLRAAGIPWIEDPSNQSEKFSRIRMRKIMSLLAEEGLTAERLAATADRMASARDALEHMTSQLWMQAVRPHEAGFVVVDVTQLVEARREIGLRLLAALTCEVGGTTYRPRFDRLQRVYDAIASQSLGNGATLGGCRFVPAPPVLSDIGGGPALLIYRELAAVAPDSLGLTAGEIAEFDHRFNVSVTGSPAGANFTVRALGEEGWQQIKSLIETALPFDVCLTVPSLWREGAVVSVPHLGFVAEERGHQVEFTAVFKGLSRFEPVEPRI